MWILWFHKIFWDIKIFVINHNQFHEIIFRFLKLFEKDWLAPVKNVHILPFSPKKSFFYDEFYFTKVGQTYFSFRPTSKGEKWDSQKNVYNSAISDLHYIVHSLNFGNLRAQNSPFQSFECDLYHNEPQLHLVWKNEPGQWLLLQPRPIVG